MNYALNLYQVLLRCLLCCLESFPPKRMEREEIELRKGLYRPEVAPTGGVIWLHAASLGEVITLRPFLRLLNVEYGKNRLFCTTTTLDGYRRVVADGLCGHASLLPIDLREYMEPLIDVMKPRIILISETEIWPLWPALAAEKGIRSVLINARINKRSVRFIKLFYKLFEEALAAISYVFPQNETYKKRYGALGFSYDRMPVLGAFKYDLEMPKENKHSLRKLYGLPDDRTVLTAGSTHDGEEAVLLDALEPFWSTTNLTLILAPRHTKRVADVEKLLRDRKLEFSKLSSKPKEAGKILLVDTLGDLQKLYITADLAFVGGSLIPRGGHNLMEPAAAAVPFFTGPHLENFQAERKALLEADAMRIVKNSQEIQTLIRSFMNDRRAFEEMGRRAGDVQKRMSGAAKRTLDMLFELNLLPER